jgi:hypothetical protein
MVLLLLSLWITTIVQLRWWNWRGRSLSHYYLMLVRERWYCRRDRSWCLLDGRWRTLLRHSLAELVGNRLLLSWRYVSLNFLNIILIKLVVCCLFNLMNLGVLKHLLLISSVSLGSRVVLLLLIESVLILRVRWNLGPFLLLLLLRCLRLFVLNHIA